MLLYVGKYPMVFARKPLPQTFFFVILNGSSVCWDVQLDSCQQHLSSLPAGLQQEGLFRVNGSVRAVDTLRQRLERCEPVDLAQESDICSVASLLKKFLRDIPEGLIHSSVQPAFIQQHQGEHLACMSCL